MVLHKRIFSITICLNIFWVFLREFPLQFFIFDCNMAILDKVVTEGKMPQNVRIACKERVNLVCPVTATLSEISSTRYSIFAHSLVSEVGQLDVPLVKALKRVDLKKNINNWLGCEVLNGSASNVVRSNQDITEISG